MLPYLLTDSFVAFYSTLFEQPWQDTLSPIQNYFVNFRDGFFMRRDRIVGVVMVGAHVVLLDVEYMQFVGK